MNSKFKVEVYENGDSHDVKFSIDHQTFFLRKLPPAEGMNSKDYANWYKQQLEIALDRLSNKKD